MLNVSIAYAAPLKVVASFSIVADLVQQVGGAQVEVSTLIKPDSDAHTFEPSAVDTRMLSQAQIFFINGLGFEPWAQRLKKSAGFKGIEVTVSQGITPRVFSPDESAHEAQDDIGEHQHGEYDPHAWQDVSNTIIYVQNIEYALSQVDSANAMQYKERAQSYIEKLKVLDQNIRTAIATLPKNHRILVTTHDSFSYFAHAYGFSIMTLMGASTEAQPSAASIAELIQKIRTQQVPALFLENVTNPQLIEMVKLETGTILGGHLYSDALTEKGMPADSYLGMMRANLSTLLKALSVEKR